MFLEIKTLLYYLLVKYKALFCNSCFKNSDISLVDFKSGILNTELLSEYHIFGVSNSIISRLVFKLKL